MRSVSSTTPNNSMRVVGGTHFPSANGTPTSLQMFLILWYVWYVWSCGMCGMCFSSCGFRIKLRAYTEKIIEIMSHEHVTCARLEQFFKTVCEVVE